MKSGTCFDCGAELTDVNRSTDNVLDGNNEAQPICNHCSNNRWADFMSSSGETYIEPERKCYTHEEAIAKARDWIFANYGQPMNMTEGDRYILHSRLGLLVDFLHTLHPPK